MKDCDKKERLATLEAENERLRQEQGRLETKLARLERKIIQLDRIYEAHENVNVRLYEDLHRLTERLAAQTARENELLLNILPAKVKEELELHGVVEPRLCNDASVLFADFKDFTHFAEKSTPIDVVERLNRFFVVFDEITEQHELEKLKTIGDAYMCAGGVPLGSDSHAIDCVQAGLEMVQAANRINHDYRRVGLPALAIRVGIHSGPLVSGIIVKRKFAFDVWGDTVNTAARVEHAGIVDAVTISAATHARMRHGERCGCEFLGSVALKGKAAELELYRVFQAT